MLGLLENGPAEELKPEFIGRVMDSFGQKTYTKGIEQEKFERLKKAVQKMLKEQEKGIEEIKKFWKEEEETRTKFVFSKELTNERVQISKEGLNIKKTIDCKWHVI